MWNKFSYHMLEFQLNSIDSETVLKLGDNQTTRDLIQEQWCSKAGVIGMASAW